MEYKNTKPFPHVVIRNAFSEEILNKALKEFEISEGVSFDKKFEKKLASKGESFGDSTTRLLRFLNSEPFINFLEKTTSIKNLIPDPHFEGGGLHEIKRGGFLGIHKDFNKHKRTGLDRRLNVLIYLNKNWKEEWGGHLEFWGKTCEKKILPEFNTMVIFSTPNAYHGHPKPLNCPEEESRKSLALYYHTNGGGSKGKHTTIFKGDISWKDFIPPIVYKLW